MRLLSNSLKRLVAPFSVILDKCAFRKTSFLDATSHLYKRVCPSVGPSICPLVSHAFVKITENRAFLHESLLQSIRNVEKLLTMQHSKSDANNNHTRLLFPFSDFLSLYCIFPTK